MRMILLGCVAAMAAGCGGKKATCETVTDHMIELRKGEDKGKEVDAEKMAKRRARDIERCEKRKPPQEMLDCMMAAKDRDSIRACRSKDKDNKDPEAEGGATKASADPVKFMQGYADQMCACKDKACADGVTKKMTDEAKSMAATKAETPTADQAKQLEEITKKFGECMTKAMTPPG